MKIILISGKQGSGKTTLAAALRERLGLSQVHKFAEPLYQMHNAIWQIMRGVLGVDRSVVDGGLLQFLGTDWGRKRFGEDVWVVALAGRIVESRGSVFVVDDLRFKSEADNLEKYLPQNTKVYRIRLEADEGIRKLRAQKWREDTDHQSEIDLDDYKGWNLVLDTNSMCADDYVAQILKVCGL